MKDQNEYIKSYDNFDVYCRKIIDETYYAKPGKLFVNKQTDISCGNVLNIYRIFYDENNKRLDNYILSDSIDNYNEEDAWEYEYRKL